MLETDPRRRFNTTRLLRVALFSFVASTVVVSVLIVLVRFLWDRFIAPAVGRDPYNADPLFVLPAIGLIAILMTKVLWDNAQGTAARRK